MSFGAFKQRLKEFFGDRSRVLHLVIPVLLGIAYYIFVRLTGVGLKCIFHEVTGFYCPGCGITHFFLDLAGMRFSELPGDNLAFLILAPAWIAFFIFCAFRKPDGKKWHQTRFFLVLSISSIVLFAVFGIVRNIPALGFLRPR